MKIFLKVILALISWGIFIFVILRIPYPDSLSQANITQLLTFFIPLYLALVASINILLKNLFISASISLGLIFTLILKALSSLNLVTALLTTTSVYLLITSFRKNRRGSLTKWSKIPKLTRLRK